MRFLLATTVLALGLFVYINAEPDYHHRPRRRGHDGEDENNLRMPMGSREGRGIEQHTDEDNGGGHHRYSKGGYIKRNNYHGGDHDADDKHGKREEGSRGHRFYNCQVKYSLSQRRLRSHGNDHPDSGLDSNRPETSTGSRGKDGRSQRRVDGRSYRQKASRDNRHESIEDHHDTSHDSVHENDGRRANRGGEKHHHPHTHSHGEDQERLDDTHDHSSGHSRTPTHRDSDEDSHGGTREESRGGGSRGRHH